VLLIVPASRSRGKMMKKYSMHFINDKGQQIHSEEMEGNSWKMKKLPYEREYNLYYDSDNIYKAQQEALREWAMKMRW